MVSKYVNSRIKLSRVWLFLLLPAVICVSISIWIFGYRTEPTPSLSAEVVFVGFTNLVSNSRPHGSFLISNTCAHYLAVADVCTIQAKDASGKVVSVPRELMSSGKVLAPNKSIVVSAYLYVHREQKFCSAKIRLYQYESFLSGTRRKVQNVFRPGGFSRGLETSHAESAWISCAVEK
jgi:hypothetical protein